MHVKLLLLSYILTKSGYECINIIETATPSQKKVLKLDAKVNKKCRQ